jgi:hypothetical protein
LASSLKGSVKNGAEIGPKTFFPRDAIVAVGALVALGKKARWQQESKEFFQVGEALLAEAVDAP